MSKKLDSILKGVPTATAPKEKYEGSLVGKDEQDTARITATIPARLKREIQQHVQSHKGETERIVLLKALKSIGFHVDDSWLIDKRTTR